MGMRSEIPVVSGKYPVIFLTFKDVKFNTWEETFSAVRIFLQKRRRDTKNFGRVTGVMNMMSGNMQG